ncbi:MAG: gfo/Idh/MocA family oxidoreductase [Chloroflexi bacterium]|nr:MAG: gfo/Idh/MocA family oxidoreductase [Chloroflexota bacterium]
MGDFFLIKRGIMPIRIAFTGTGSISKVHARAAQAQQDVELAAVVNHRPESRLEFARVFDIPRQYETIEAMIAGGGVDLVVISTPNYLHASQTIAALEAGIHVMVEKPMAKNAAEAERMVEASQKSGAKLMVAHNFRFDPEVLWLKSQVGIIGKIIRTKGYGVHVRWGPAGWFTEKQYAGAGALADVGVHAIDTTRFLLGDPNPVSVYAKIGTFYRDYDLDDTGILIVEWENGTISYIESGWWQPHSDGPMAAVQLYGTNGFGQIFPSRVEVYQPGTDGVETLEPGLEFPRAQHARQEMYDSQLTYFIDCIQSDRDPVPGGNEGLVNMRIIDAAYVSSRIGKVIYI